METKCTFHLISLRADTSATSFLARLSTLQINKPLLVAKPLKWIAPPAILAPELINIRWDLFLGFADPQPPSAWSSTSPLGQLIAKEYTITVSAPIQMVDNYHKITSALATTASQPLTNPITDTAESIGDVHFSASASLTSWAQSQPRTPVTMFNLLSFLPGGQEIYMGYVTGFQKAFVETGFAAAPLFGPLVEREGGYEMMGLIQYRSPSDFTDMLASEQYKSLDRKYKGESLKENAIFCLREFERAENGKNYV